MSKLVLILAMLVGQSVLAQDWMYDVSCNSIKSNSDGSKIVSGILLIPQKSNNTYTLRINEMIIPTKGSPAYGNQVIEGMNCSLNEDVKGASCFNASSFMEFKKNGNEIPVSFKSENASMQATSFSNCDFISAGQSDK